MDALSRPGGLPYPDSQILHDLGEHFAAGYFELPDVTPFRRWSRAVRRRFEHAWLPPYDGSRLYPTGNCHPPSTVYQNRILAPQFSYTWSFDQRACERYAATSDRRQRDTLHALAGMFRKHGHHAWDLKTPHTVAGNCYTHSVPNYQRVLAEGLDTYDERIAAHLKEVQGLLDDARTDFYLGLQEVVSGIRSWHQRMIDHLLEWKRNDPESRSRRDRLVSALKRVPFQPVRTFFEALVAHNVIFYLDDCDNPGRLDLELAPFYEADVAKGRITRDEALALISEFTQIVCDNGTWSASIGGTDPSGSPAFNEVTLLCLEAVKGRHRPNYQLRARQDMPDTTWEAALQAIGSGCGQPALHNEELYLKSLRAAEPRLTDEDLAWWNGAGCTETLIQGHTNCGCIDAGINLLLILEQTLIDELPGARSWDDFLVAYKKRISATVEQITSDLNNIFRNRAKHVPQPMRTLFTDDCIDRGLDFNAGGARYNWSLINAAGLANVVDSLAVVRETVFERKEVNRIGLLETLRSDFKDNDLYLRRIDQCPRFGNDRLVVDRLAAELLSFVYSEIRSRRIVRGDGPFLPACIMFQSAAPAGRDIGATPDGRRAGAPIADSIGPYQGRDKDGPTAMLKSVTRLPLHLATGTPVLNLRLSKSMFGTPESRAKVRDLIRGYFEMGGMQVQISVADQETLRDAIEHPERHENLIVRVGGFSSKFNALSEDLKLAILERTEHEL